MQSVVMPQGGYVGSPRSPIGIGGAIAVHALAAGIFLLSWVQLFIFIIGGMLTGSSEDFITPAGSWVVSIHPITGVLMIFMSYWLFNRARAAALNPQPLPPKAAASDASASSSAA